MVSELEEEEKLQETVSEIPIKVLFSPDHNPEMEIMKQMLKGRKQIDFAIFTFSQSSGIDETMMAQTDAGVKIQGALDGMMANREWAAPCKERWSNTL